MSNYSKRALPGFRSRVCLVFTYPFDSRYRVWEYTLYGSYVDGRRREGQKMTVKIVRAMPDRQFSESSSGELLPNLRNPYELMRSGVAAAPAEARRQGQRFLVIATLPERDQKAVVRTQGGGSHGR